MSEVNARENDLILSQTEYAFIQDTAQSGRVTVYVGPRKDSLGQTDCPVSYNHDTKRYDKCSLKDAINPWVYADEQSYVVLENPTADEKSPNPERGKGGQAADLKHGKTVNIQGPVTFPLFPGQIAKVIMGHQLRSNQYLVVKDLNGTLDIIRGTEKSFYIPPTGTQVVKDDKGLYVREALTLERLEYCILKDENGKKRYVNGPEVVFPKPTETFINDKSNGTIKFNAIELNENMGIHIKVISDYTEDNIEYQAGDELFITGNELRIYFPREEHAIVKYGADQIRQYAIAVPKGEARYVLDKSSGIVKTVKGPVMLLPDPRKEVVVKRVLSQKDTQLLYPANVEALTYNMTLAQADKNTAGYIEDDSHTDFSVRSKSSQTDMNLMYASNSTRMDEVAAALATTSKFGDTMKRGTKFTPPRTITLDNKYEGAVNVNIWPGYAVQVVSKTGERQLVTGPQCIMLDYDQTLERMSLSTGNPKNTDRLLETVYLRVRDNKVSDTVVVETSDMVKVDIKLSYVVNFEDESEKWFTVENYVKLLTDNLRSIIRNTIKKHGIEDINKKGIDIIRDTILGAVVDNKRLGRKFSNGMRVCEVEIMNIVIGDTNINALLHDAQTKSVINAISVEAAQRELNATKLIESCTRQKIDEKLETTISQANAETKINSITFEKDKAIQAAKVDLQTLIDKIAASELAREKASNDEELRVVQSRIEAETKSYVERYTAITPELISAINSLGQNELATTLAKNLPQATGTNGYLFGAGGIEGLLKMVAGTPIEKALKETLKKE